MNTNSGVEAFPLAWPFGKPRNRNPQRSRFAVNFAKTCDELMREIELLGGRLPVLSSNIPLKRDGLPYAGQKEPDDKGVAVYFTLKNQQFCFACDRWDKVGDNIQAIRHTIAALRGIERWGRRSRGMGRNHDIIEIAGELRGETDKAYCLFDGKTTEWVPKSQCEWDEKDNTMQMPEWLALDKGFI